MRGLKGITMVALKAERKGGRGHCQPHSGKLTNEQTRQIDKRTGEERVEPRIMKETRKELIRQASRQTIR